MFNKAIVTLAIANLLSFSAYSLELTAEEAKEILIGNTDRAKMPDVVKFPLQHDSSLEDGRYYVLTSLSVPEVDTINVMRSIPPSHYSLVEFHYRGMLAEHREIPQMAENVQAIGFRAGVTAIPTYINPQLFRQYEISKVPTILYRKDDNVYKISGTMSYRVLDSAMEKSNYREDDLGIVGNVYNILERDLIEEIEERAANYDIEGALDTAKNRYWSKYELEPLPTSQEDRSFDLDMTITVSQNIHSDDGTLIVAAGSKFNPFDLFPFNRQVIVINGTIENQVKLAALLVEKAKQDKTIPIVVTSAIDPEEGFNFLPNLSYRINAKVGILSPEIRSRFKIVAVPAVIRSSELHGYMRIDYTRCDTLYCKSIEGVAFND